MNEPQVDSLENTQRIVAGATKEIKVPPGLGPLAKKYFKAGLTRRAKVDWDLHDLGILAQLAGMMELLQYEREALAREGTMVTSENGVPFPSPRIGTITKFVTSIATLNRTIGLQHAARPGNPGPKQKRDKISSDIEKHFEEPSSVRMKLIKR